MANEKIIVGIADDEQEIHDLFDEFVAGYEYIKLEHFYSTADVEFFLDDDPNGLDMLFLDLVFQGSESGTKGLIPIKECAPDLPVIFLTGHDKSNPEVDYLIETKMAIDYMEKPVSKKFFLNKIRSIKNIFSDIDNLKQDIENNYKDLQNIADEYEQKYQELYLNWNTANKDREAFNRELDELASKVIPERVRIMFIKTYTNLEFRDKVVVELFGKNYDPRIFDLLGKVNYGEQLGTGAKIQLFPEFGIPNLYEYRISQKARLFIQQRPGQKMLVYDVDYNHDKH